MSKGKLGILNVGAGDTKIIFDKSNPQDTIRAGRIVTDMLRRGYALLIEVEKDGKKTTHRVKEFDPATSEYIIADFDPTVAEDDTNDEAPAEAAPAKPAARSKIKTKRIPAETASGVAVARRAGG